MNEITFEAIERVENMQEVIQEVFGVNLDIDGDWGYNPNRSVIVRSLDMPIDQFLHMFATIRANIEMNMTIEDENERYGGIKVNFIDGKQIELENKTYDMITFEINAMKEKTYAGFIQEYKDNYGKNKDFDMDDHFKRREQSTISFQSDFWFEGLEKYYHEESEIE